MYFLIKSSKMHLSRRISLILVVFLKWFLSQKAVEGYIVRTPCRYTGNFSTILAHQYKSGHVHSTITNVNASRCTTHCLLTPECQFINHKMDNTECQLMTSLSGSLLAKNGWRYLSTDYSNWKYRGPVCRYLQSKCDYESEFCADTCTEPGYKCTNLINIALNKNTQCSSAQKECSKVVDGSHKSYWSASEQLRGYVRIDLGERYKILFASVIPPTSKNLLEYTQLKIGVNQNIQDNHVCNSFSKHKGRTVYFCRGGWVIGQYVFFESIKQRARGMHVGEIQVYTF